MSICGYHSSMNIVDEDGTVPLCFLDLILFSCNSLFLAIMGTIRYREVRKSPSVEIRYTRLQIAKVILMLLLAGFPLLRSIANIIVGEPALYIYLSGFIISATIIYAMVIMMAEYSRAMRNHWVLRSWWVIHFMLSSLQFQTALYHEGSKADFTIALLNFPVAFAMASIGLFANKIHEAYEALLPAADHRDEISSIDRKISPETQSGIISRLTFGWLNPLLKLGYKRPLEATDLYEVPDQYHGKNVSEIFEAIWEEEKRKPNPSLVRTFRKAYGRPFYFAGLLKFCQDSLLFVGPVLLQATITYVKDPTIPEYQGFFYALAIFVASVSQSIFLHQYFFIAFNTGMRLRSAVVAVVYQKAFQLSNKARQQSTQGEIVNLQAVDSSRLQELFPYLHMVWSAPFQMIVSLVMLWGLLGPSVLAGLAVTVLTTPLNGIILRKLQAIQKQMMVSKDNRVKIMNEVLNGIRVIKFFAWEKSFLEKISEIRSSELNTLKKTLLLRALSMVFWSATPVLVSVTTFAIYTLVGNELTPEKAFTAISLFNILRFPLNILPMVLSGLIEARVSLQRLSKYLLSEELNPNAVDRVNDPEFAVQIKNGTFQWEGSATSTLTDISVKIPHGRLFAAVGTVGSGKSSLLSAVLGEIPKINGQVTVSGRVAYVAQQAWIQNASLRENILFGKPFNQKKYDEVLRVCELVKDIAILPQGDATEIGEKGINLSGGQKQRVSLARAVYQDVDIYLLDDCLSAVDAHVGRNIFQNCISGLLRGKTRILVTHQLQFVSNADSLIVFKNGRITESGTYEELMAANNEFAALINAHVKESQEEHHEESEKTEEATKSEKKEEKKPGGKIMTAEERDVGNVDSAVYKAYLSATGGLFVGFLIFFGYALDSGSKLGADFWLSYWSTNPEENSLGFYLGIFTGLSLSACVIVYLRTLLLNYAGLNAAQVLHDRMLEKVMRAPMSFFDTTPIGRVLNRFSKDQYTVDDSLSRTLGMFLGMTFSALSVLIVIGVATPFFLTGLLPLAFLYRYIQKYYLQSSRELKRLDSITRSPIYAQFSETLNGLSTIRSYQRQGDFIDQNNQKLDSNTCAYYALQTANRWLGVRLEFLGTCLVSLAALFAVVERENLGPGLAGLSITYALQMTGILNWLVRTATEVETSMVSVERVLHYTQLPTEAASIIPGKRPPSNWPSQGAIQFKDVKMRYREGLDLVLRGISLDIKPKEKIGVVGRTGAGKSSLMLALFRLVELSEGTITIDDIDISTIGLDDLREKLSIIPQEPTLFTGTIRSNLDPFNQHQDHELWQVLKAIHLKDVVEQLPLKLDAPCAEFGENYSVGQRQLLCLGRALLRRAKVLVMDEATAAIDFETDALIQKTIREEFKDVTVLTIAHRIHTIMDYDRVLVLDKGLVAEYDRPGDLLLNPKSIFASMASKSGTTSTKDNSNDSTFSIE